MLRLIAAINRAADGKTIVSNTGRPYTPEMLAPIYCGPHYAVFTAAGMTESERKGYWTWDA